MKNHDHGLRRVCELGGGGMLITQTPIPIGGPNTSMSIYIGRVMVLMCYVGD